MALDLQLRAAFTQSVRNVDAAGEPGGDPSHKLFLAQKGKTGLKVALRLLREARAQALVVSNSIERDRLVGAEAMQRRSRAVDYLLQALDIAAEGGARYAFLAYNASVHAWNVLRTALRPRRAGDHATELLRFSDALEASNDSDLRWRCNLLMAVSLALGDKGDASAAAAKAALSVQHAEDLARGEREAADIARGRLNEAKDRVAVAQAQIRKIEEAGTCSADATILEDGGSEAGGASEGSILSASASGSGKSWLGTGEKLAAAVTSRASAEKDAVEAGRKLTPLAKTAAEAAALAERAWMFQAYSAAQGAAAGGSDATKVLEMLRSQASGDARLEALLLQQEVAAGALTGDAVLQALNPVAEALDPGGVTLLAKAFARESAGQGGEVETTNGKDTTAIGGGDVGGSGGGGGGGEKKGRAEPLLPSLPTPSLEAQSVFVDLGRIALKSASPDDLASSSPHELQHSLLLLNFARACHLRASSSAGKGKPTTGGSGTIPSPAGASKDETAVVSPAAFRARLELLAAELAAHGMLSGHTSDGDGNNDLKLDARRTDAAKLADRVEALKRVERLLLNCKRLGDPELLQILQDVESPLARLRAQLHLEVAKCEVDSDFLAKAASQVEKASGQDYGVSDAATLPPEAPLDGEWDDEPGKPFSEGNNDRPRGGIAAKSSSKEGEVGIERLTSPQTTKRGRFMMPLASFLRLKTSVDVEPTTAEDKALLLIDQGKHAADPFLRRTLMARAAEQLYIATSDQEALDGDDLSKPTTTANTAGVASSAARGPQQQQILMSESPVRAKEAAGLNRKDDDDEIFAARFAAQDADGSGEEEQAESIPQPSSKSRLARLWFTLLELAVDDGRGGEGGGGRDAGLARKAAVAVLRSGPWSPERNRELVVLQARAQYMLGETYVEELRLADTDFLGSAGSDSQKPLGQVTDSNTGGDGPGPNSTKAAADPRDVTNKEESRGRHATKESQDGVGLDPRTMGIPTAACTAEVSSGVADMLDGLKKKACGCFVGGMRRAARAKEPALIENGAVFVYNFHMPVRHATAFSFLVVTDVERHKVNTNGLEEAPTSPGNARPSGRARGVRKSGNTKKGDAVGTKDAESCGGATSAQRATVSELKGVVEVRAACQAARAGVAAVTGEGRPLFHALALLTAASVLSAGDGSDGATAATGDLVERCVAVMREYRGAIRSSTAARQARKKTRDGGSAEQGKSGVGAEATGASPAPAHEGGCSGGGGDGGGEGEEPEENKKIDLFAALSGRAGTSLEEDRAELELVGEIWCRLGKERLARGNKREAEECCGYVIELLPQIPADRRKVHPRLWRWLAVGEGLWGQAIASMVSPESQEKPLQDELRRVSMRHLALSAKFGTLASSSVVTLDIAKRLWNVALPLADTAAGRAIARSPVRAVLREMAKGGILEGGAVRAQLYVLLFECYSDRSEWKQGLAAVTDSLRFIPPEFQRPLWRWRVVFLSRLGITALDGVAKTKESDKVLQGKSWCTLARSAREPKQQLSAYLKALECLGDRFERLDCLVEMGEWATGRGLASAGADYLRAALDLLYDVEESAMQATEEEQEGGRSSGQDLGHDGDDRDNGKAADEEGTRCRGEASSRASSRSHQSGLKRSASKASSAHGTSHGGSRGSSRGAHGSQGGASSSAEPDQNGYPETLTMGHLETAVRVLTMLARGAVGGSGSGGGFSCSMFDERLDLLLQAHYFVGRMAAMVAETVECGRRWRLYEDNVPEGTERAETPFQEWWDAHGEAAEEAEGKPSTGRPPPIASQPPVHLRDWASWRPESDPDLYRHMAVPPPGRAPYVLSTATIEKPPLLFHHLLDLAEGMEDHGLAAHAAAPLAMSELVARLCLGAPLSAGTGVGDGGAGENAEELVAAAESFPALALACLRRSRLLLKLGPTCQRAALQAAAAAGPLGVSAEEAARRGAEVDRILRQREEEDSDQEQQVGLGGRVVVAPPSPDQAKATSSGGSKTVPTGSGSVEEAGGGLQNGANAGVTQPLPPTLGKLEDRKLWALLAKEAVLLGECQAAAEYLTAAQRHNDAFHDRENIVSCLEAQAALCDAQGHPEQGLPCLLRASALLRAPGVSGSTAGRWGKMAISIGGMMRKANMGDAKIRQALQTGCDALERSIFRNLDKLETGEEVGMTGEMGRLGASRSSMDTTNGVTRPSVVDLDAAIAFSGCISLLAEASGTLDDSNALAPPVLGVSTAARGTVVGQERPGRKMRNMCTASNATATRSVALLQDGASNEDGHRHQEHGVLPAAVRLLSDAADKLRPLGKHPALPAILRRMAQEWVRRWAKAPAATDTAARSVETPAAAARGAARGTTPSPAAGVSRAKCLENAAACLAEARAALSALAAAAEPTGDVLSSAPPAARERAPAKNESDDDDAEAPAAKAKGKNGKGGAGSQKGGNSKAAAAGDFAQGSSDAAVLSTPVGRSLVMVQLEEACVRAMLGRIRGEARSSKKAEEAAANDEGTNPVQRYLEASRPLGHPTPEEMGVPQLEQALALAQMARERCSLSSFLAATSSSTWGDGKSIPTGETNAPPTGLLPLALAWEGSTLALLAARGESSTQTCVPATPPQATTPDLATATKGGKGAASKGGKAAAEKGGKGGKGGAAAAAVVSGDDDEKTHVDVPPIQEGFNLREQARWKLARAMETAVAGKRWDAAGAAAFALAEMLGGNDAPSAAAALMLHQSCRARERMLRLLHTALPKSSRYRLCMDRVNTAQGSLRGMHNLDACDSFAVPRPVEAEASAVGAAGEGAVSSITEFPSSEASEKFLSANLAGWRRLDCATGSNNVGESSLRVLPQGLGVLSLQVFSPDGTTLYAAGYAPPSPSAVETPSGGTDNAHDTRIVPAANAAFVWRHEMKAREVCALSDLGSRMKAFQGSVKRHCLEKCDEEGKRGDYNVVESASISDGTAITPQQHSATPLPSQSSRKAGSEHSDGNSQGGLKTASSTATVPVTSSAGTLATVATAECEVELDAIIAATESLLLPVFGEGIDGSLAPFLARCREEELSLILLLDESLENLPLEACAALGGIRSVSRDLSLSLLHHRCGSSLPDASRDDGVVSNARMRYVADPLSQDPGVLPSPAPRLDAGGAVAAAGTSPKGKERGDGGKKKTAVAAESRDDQEEWSGRPSILKVLRERVDQSKAGGGGGKGATGSVKVAAWKGVAGDDHVPGVPEWQALVSGSASTAAPAGGPDRSEGGFVFYGLGRCLSKLSPESIAGLSVNCKAAILIDRADNSASRRLESKQDTLKSPEEMDAEEPSQTAALFSLVGCQSVVLNMWSVTLHSNQRIICSLFRRWGEEGLTLGAALSAVRGETAVKPRARFGTVLYGLPTLKYGP
ncbi:unnamed protein product [Scytosiphon promiscuus]